MTKNIRSVVLTSFLVVIAVGMIGGFLCWRWLYREGVSGSWLYYENVHIEQVRSLTSDDADFQYGYCMISFSVDRRFKGSADEKERILLEIPLREDAACLGSAIFSDTDYLTVSVILSVPNAERSLVPHRGDGSVDWETIAFDPELAKRYAKINGIKAEG
ncbi:MAG: hypothetical protein PUC59_00785 [Firmicutes bacterium]|nr:hypothetical protein [Bacillota bacterium]